MKVKIQKTILWIFATAVALSILAAVVTPAFDSRTTNGLNYDFSSGWKYVDSKGNISDFNQFGTTIDSGRIMLLHSLDSISPELNSIGFYNYYSAVDVFIDQELIYSYGSLEDIQNGVLLGNYYSMVNIYNGPDTGNTLRLVFRNIDPQTIYPFDIGNGPTLEMVMIREYISTLILPIITILFFVVTIIIVTKRTTNDLLSRTQLWLIAFSFNISIWIIADSQLPMDIGIPAGSVCLLSFESYMLLPTVFNMLMYYSCTKFRQINRIFCGLGFANFVVLNFLNYAGIVRFINSLASTHIIIFASLVLGLVQVILERTTRKDLYTLDLIIGYSIFFISVLIQYANFAVNPTASNSQILQIGAIIFVILQITNVLRNVNNRIYQVTVQLEMRNKVLEQTFGSFLPNEMIQSIIEAPDEFGTKGDTKQIAVIQSDIRGFTELIIEMDAKDVIDMINHYLEAMTVVIGRFGGTIMEFVGDGIIAIFDQSKLGEKYADKAIMAAVEMQHCMQDINAWNENHKYPSFEMGIGINTGLAYVGYIGSKAKMKYDALGSTINMVSRIESYSTGGQILLSQSTKDASKMKLEIDDEIKVLPKGAYEEVSLYHLGAIGAPYNIECRFRGAYPKTLDKPIYITFFTVENKHCGDEMFTGQFIGLSKSFATLQTDCPLRLYDNLRIETPEKISCKVISKSSNGILLRFTSNPIQDK